MQKDSPFNRLVTYVVSYLAPLLCDSFVAPKIDNHKMDIELLQVYAGTYFSRYLSETVGVEPPGF